MNILDSATNQLMAIRTKNIKTNLFFCIFAILSMKILKSIFQMICWVIPIACLAQYGGAGKWGDHYSYSNAIAVVLVEDEVCAITQNGIFYYDKENHSVRRKTTLQGLSGVGLSASAYEPSSQTLIVGYENGDIDLIQNDRVFNIPDLKRKPISGSKKINKIVVENNQKTYLCCDFGIVVLNCEKQEISETYFIGNNNSSVQVNDLTMDDSSFFAATDVGLLMANRFSLRLNDFSEWTEKEVNSRYGLPIQNVCVWNKNLIVRRSSDLDTSSAVLRYSQEKWTVLDTTQTSQIKVSDGQLLQFRKAPQQWIWELAVYDTGFQIVQRYGANPNALLWGLTDAVMERNGEVWIAPGYDGIMHLNKDWVFTHSVCPKGPEGNQVYSLYHSATKLYAAQGSVSSGTWRAGDKGFLVNILKDHSWKTIDYRNFSQVVFPTDAVAVAEDPNNPDMFFSASWNGGVVQVNPDATTVVYNSENSTLQKYYWDSENFAVRCGDVKFEYNKTSDQKQLWVTNAFAGSVQPSTGEQLHKRTPSGEWKGFNLSHLISTLPKEFIIDYYNQLWIRTFPNKLFFFRETTTGFDVLAANLNLGNNQQIGVLNCLVEDKNGYVWLGTDRGILINRTSRKLFENPNGNESSVEFETIICEGFPLMGNENVTAIAVDGADRKWIGTSSSGIFLMSADGKEKILQFNTENSPLNSNTITAIAINPKNGEVYIGTDRGLMSFGGDASEGSQTHQQIVIFPNPVSADFSGDISICGTVNNANVHITDVSGRLIFSTTALGGMVAWDGKTTNGKRAKPGIYIVYTSNADGEVTAVKKIFINK